MIDGGELHLADELGPVHGAELVAAGGVVFQVGGEEGRFEGGRDVAEEGVLLFGRDGVGAHEAEAHQAVGVDVVDEGLRDRGGKLDGLGWDDGAADGDGVSAYVAQCAGFIAVADVEGTPLHGFEGCAFLRVVGGVPLRLLRGQLRVKHP